MGDEVYAQPGAGLERRWKNGGESRGDVARECVSGVIVVQ